MASGRSISTSNSRNPSTRATSRFAPETAGTFTPAKDRLDVAALARWLREDLYQGIVVLIGGLEPDEQEEVFHFCRDFGAPVVAEATSGLREALQALAIHDADRVLMARPPGKILRLGEVPSGTLLARSGGTA